MSKGARQPVGYRIVVRGELGPHALASLQRITLEAAGSDSVLTLETGDRDELQDVLHWLGDAGIDVLRLTKVEASPRAER